MSALTAPDAVVDDLRLQEVPVTGRTRWLVVRATAADRVGLGEASDVDGRVAGTLVAALGSVLRGRSVGDAAGWLAGPGPRWAAQGGSPADRLARWTALGGVATAVADLAARLAGVSVAEWLGGPGHPRPIPLYANLNRALTHRTPQAAAELARRAVAAGFTAVKCAPFDHLPPPDRARRGVAIAAAVRDAVGPRVALMVDVHHNLDLPELLSVAADLAALDLTWLEDPVPITDVSALRAVRDAVGAPIAGGEFSATADEVLPALRAGALDVLMPDVKHAGGPAGALRLARIALAHGADVSLHNPSGPVATAASGHVTALLPTRTPLEIMFGEHAARPGLVAPAEAVRAGCLHLAAGPGLGLRLAAEEVSGDSRIA